MHCMKALQWTIRLVSHTPTYVYVCYIIFKKKKWQYINLFSVNLREKQLIVYFIKDARCSLSLSLGLLCEGRHDLG